MTTSAGVALALFLLALPVDAWLSSTSFPIGLGRFTSALHPLLRASFRDFFDDELISRLKTELSVMEPNEIQQQALGAFFVDRPHASVVVCAQTGSGKTLTFLLPILQTLRDDEKAKALVLAPTNLLVEQHRDVAAILEPAVLDRIHFASSSSSIPENIIQRVYDDGAFQIIAIDEIDAVLYGTSKMDEETQLTNIGQVLLPKFATTWRVLGTTAFLSSAHQKALLERDLPGAELLREHGITSAQTQVLVPTLRQKFNYFSGNRIEKLVHVVRAAKQDDWLNQGSTMIFCGHVEQAQEVYAALVVDARDDSNDDTSMILLHEELDQNEIHSLMMQLRHDCASTALLVCTDVAARGLDIPNIRHVILHTVPTTVSAFIHQVGRTARKGQSGLLTCLVNTSSGDAQKYTHLHALKAASALSFHS